MSATRTAATAQAELAAQKLQTTAERLIRTRYPVSAAVWFDVAIERWTPPWTEEAFSGEWQVWRDLGEAAQRLGDDRYRPWGRYARWAMRRIAAECWRSVWVPLRHARAVLSFWRIERERRGPASLSPVISQVGHWLGHMPTLYGDIFAKARMRGEARTLRMWVRQWTKAGWVEPAVQARFESQLGRYLARGEQAPSGPSPLPWLDAGAMEAAEWSERRRQYPVREWSGVDRAQAVESATWSVSPAQQQLIAALGAEAWYLPARDTVFYGPEAGWQRMWAEVLAEVWHEAQADTPLAGMLAEPEHWTAAAWRRLQTEPARGLAAAWLQTMEVMALADAWLWLEGGEPEEVAKWLSQVCGPEVAYPAVAAMKCEPGRWVRRAVLTWQAS
ncbi:MAG: hypothetical protein K6U87_03695 [Firmicutes bacterium]|nr:hypothetical protein [Bacillota bacterium]